MKIAMIFFGLTAPGGSASVFLSLADELRRQGNDVDVYCYYFDPKNCFPDLTKKINIYYIKKVQANDYILNNNSLWSRARMAIDYYVNAKKIFDVMQKQKDKYDLIYSSEAIAYLPALKYSALYKTPVYWSVFDPISLVDGNRPGMIINKYFWFKYILKLHNHFDNKSVKRINKIIVPTNKMKLMLDRFYKINCAVLPTAGIRLSDFQNNYSGRASQRLKNKFGFAKRNEVILYSNGHFFPHRRYEDNLYALKKLKNDKFNFKYIISGSDKFDPQYFKFICNLIKILGIQNDVIIDCEFKTNIEIIGYYQYCDIFLFVSIEQTWGLAPFEAMAAKKPVVISRGVGCSEVLKNNIHAIIVSERCPNEIVDRVKCLVNSQTLRTRIAENGHNHVKHYFTYQSIAKQILSMS